jgi:hypothetical protein
VTLPAVESRPAYLRINGEISDAYNEAAFRYFLAIERTRAERSARPLLLLLVKLRKSKNQTGVSQRTSAAIFAALRACVREVDFVGWYREAKVAGAVLAPSGPAPENLRHQLRDRVVQALTRTLSAAGGARVDVRVLDASRKPRM